MNEQFRKKELKSVNKVEASKSIENKEFFRATLSFDFIFISNQKGEKGIKCIEINGEDSGIFGVLDLPKKKGDFLQKLFAEIRGRDFWSKLNFEITEILNSTKKQVLEVVSTFPDQDPYKKRFEDVFLNSEGREAFTKFNDIIREPAFREHFEVERIKSENAKFRYPYMFRLNDLISEIDDKCMEVVDKYNYGKDGKVFIHAFKNEKLIQDICDDKSRQIDIIPEKYNIRTLVPTVGVELPDSPSGYWVVKPQFGSRGKDIEILDNYKAQSLFRVKAVVYNSNRKLDKLVFQEYIESVGADLAEGEYKTRPQSMRLLMDFVYKYNGEIDTVFRQSYQRVGWQQVKDWDLTGTAVINKSTGAASFPVSEEEEKMARVAADEIIKNLIRMTPYGIIGHVLLEGSKKEQAEENI